MARRRTWQPARRAAGRAAAGLSAAGQALQLTGQIASTELADPLRPGVESFLSLGGVDTGKHHFWRDPVWGAETTAVGTVRSFSGPLQSTGCSVVRGVCSGFESLYAAPDPRARLPGAPAGALQTARRAAAWPSPAP